MRRFLVLLSLCIVLAGALWLPASAESAASRVDMLCTVNTDGSCLVAMNVTLRLEAAYDDMFFPLPYNAKNVTMNGAGVAVTRTSNAANVDIGKITRGYTGEAVLRFEYAVPDVVQVNPARELQLSLPLLTGFRYPVERLSFTVTLPVGEMPDQPHFYSIYRQSGIEADLTWEVRGSQIIGNSTNPMNDHEGVNLNMKVSKAMFPGVSTYVRDGNPELVPMLVFAGLALLYWILFLRTLPILPSPATTAPAGISAGELGCRLTLTGGDLTGMVFTWAQLGYVLIYLDGSGRVLLHKRMDMGNERSAFENRVFKDLFGSRRVVDATGKHYAQLLRRVAAQIPKERSMYKGTSGNVKLFRWLACVSQGLCGINVGLNMDTTFFFQVVLAVILSLFGLVSAWQMQRLAYRIHLRGKGPIWAALGLLLLWTGLGLLSGQVWIPLGCSAGEILFGFLAAYGGRRSDLGRHDASQVLGLRKYLKKLPNEAAGRLMKNDPDFFFNMAPYALSLGVLKTFAGRFSRRKLDQCPYLITRVHGKRTADDWAALMIEAADRMDARAKTLRYEKMLSTKVRVSRSKR